MSENPQERTMGMLCHLLALCGLAIPFGNILGPLVLWLVKKEGMPFVDDQGKESLNFQISVAIYGAGAFLLSLIGANVHIGIGIVIGVALGVFWLVMVIIATVRANNGERYRYPLTIRLLK